MPYILSLFRFFDRDVTCVREYFRRRFGYECAGFPVFEDLTRDDNLDIEVACSGFTKEMERDILQEYGMESCDEDDDDADDNDDGGNVSDHNETNETTETELNALRKQLETEVQFSEERKTKSSDKSVSIQKYIESLSVHLQQATFNDETDIFEDAIDSPIAPQPVSNQNSGQVRTSANVAPVKIEPTLAEHQLNVNDVTSIHSDDPQSDDDELADLDPASREYRYKMVEKVLNDARSQRSYSTTASTIAPSVIKDRIRKNIDLKKQQEVRKRCVAKGEASAVTRKRNENRDTCKEYAGWDF